MTAGEGARVTGAVLACADGATRTVPCAAVVNAGGPFARQLSQRIILGAGAASAGEGAFDFELLATFTALVDGPDVFTGVVLLDAEGWVVWYLSLPYDESDEESLGETGYAVYDWVPNSYDLVVLRAVNNYWDLTPSLLAQLSEVTPLGDIAAEYDYIRQLRQEAADAAASHRALTADERETLILGLKAKWEAINREYQQTTHLTKLDTLGKMKRKAYHEATLTEIEKSIEKMRKSNIMIDLNA